MTRSLQKNQYPGKVAIRHAVTTARAVGIDVAGFDLLPDGTIRVLDARAIGKPKDEFELWEQSGKLG